MTDRSSRTPHEDNPDSIKYHVKKYINNNRVWFSGKKVLDLPAGSGVTSRLLAEVGAEPQPYDLFPSFFHSFDKKIKCKFCDISVKIPARDSTFDAALCQEGIEHFTDQLHALSELNRVIKKDGLLAITTPNYSSLQSRLSYLLFESENSGRLMPPNEFDTVWFSGSPGNTKNQSKYYFGHAFLLNIQKLRFLWTLAGFELEEIVPNRVKPRNVLLLVFYPFIYLASLVTVRKNLRQTTDPEKRKTYKGQFKLNTSLRILLNSHLFVVLRKKENTQDAARRFQRAWEGNRKPDVET